MMDFIDDELYALKKKAMKKYNLKWEEARDEVNRSLRILMLGFPGEWL
jgi:hypothetical protein